MTQAQDGLRSLNQYAKDIGDIYHDYAIECALSDSAMCIIYHLWLRGDSAEPCTQREICAQWSYSPQTINSALKGLEAQGFVSLTPLPGNRRQKRIALTPWGSELARRHVAPLVAAEEAAFAELGIEDHDALLRIMGRYTALLRAHIGALVRRAR